MRKTTHSIIAHANRDGSVTGLTLLELIVVMAIITILAGVAVPTLSTFIDNKTTDESAERMQVISDSMQSYARDLLALPGSLDDLASSSATNWRGPYIPKYIQGWAATEPDFRNDNWGRALQWSAGSDNTGTITCAGPNGVMGDDDDLSLEVDIRPLLRELTVDRLRIVNTAIQAYNAQDQGEDPLTGNAEAVVDSLKVGGFLPDTQSWDYDLFGTRFNTDGNPVVGFYSSNILNGYGASSGGDDPDDDPDDDHDDDHEEDEEDEEDH